MRIVGRQGAAVGPGEERAGDRPAEHHHWHLSDAADRLPGRGHLRLRRRQPLAGGVGRTPAEPGTCCTSRRSRWSAWRRRSGCTGCPAPRSRPTASPATTASPTTPALPRTLPRSGEMTAPPSRRPLGRAAVVRAVADLSAVHGQGVGAEEMHAVPVRVGSRAVAGGELGPGRGVADRMRLSADLFHRTAVALESVARTDAAVMAMRRVSMGVAAKVPADVVADAGVTLGIAPFLDLLP
ncbi:hypothetical protein QF030_007680 [Streptomyces rishiriensis]|uniref:Uncharacterized protein n=1 Tax=Streptomyces rishiriensis TaxID=68264 RepID=A0ABU0P285_STRRH|nr:hypothetical protein [Streptomyces rishiriensis]